jgi:uncharacterized protein
MWIGWIEFDLLLGDVHSLKEKRAAVRPLVAELRRRFQVSAAEVDHHELYRRTAVGMSCVSGQRAHLVEVLDNAEHLVAGRGAFDLLSAHRGFSRSED